MEGYPLRSEACILMENQISIFHIEFVNVKTALGSNSKYGYLVDAFPRWTLCFSLRIFDFLAISPLLYQLRLSEFYGYLVALILLLLIHLGHCRKFQEKILSWYFTNWMIVMTSRYFFIFFRHFVQINSWLFTLFHLNLLLWLVWFMHLFMNYIFCFLTMILVLSLPPSLYLTLSIHMCLCWSRLPQRHAYKHLGLDIFFVPNKWNTEKEDEMPTKKLEK